MVRKGWSADGAGDSVLGGCSGRWVSGGGFAFTYQRRAGLPLAGGLLMGSALCGGAGPWPPLPPEMVEDYEEWVAAGRPGLEEAETVVDAVEREAD